MSKKSCIGWQPNDNQSLKKFFPLAPKFKEPTQIPYSVGFSWGSSFPDATINRIQVWYLCMVMCAIQSGALFQCPHCGYRSTAFHAVCPECGRPFQRDYIDTGIHPRDPEPTGVITSRFWARVFLILLAVSVAIGVIAALLL
jgi:hypothetical protein